MRIRLAGLLGVVVIALHVWRERWPYAELRLQRVG